jgi:IS30 family transposase
MKHLTFDDRKVIEKLLKQNLSYRAIGRALCRSHTTISDEIRLNSGQLGYSAERAQYYHERRQANKGSRKKLDANEKLKAHIIRKLKEDWSPEEISGRLKEFPDEDIGYVCHETIYEYIYSTEGIRLKLYLLLRRYKPKRTKWHSRKKNKINIPERTSIHDRPDEISGKAEAGHWETDSMIFSQQKGILSVQVERKTKLTRLHRCPDKTAAETLEAIIKTIDSVPLKYFLSATFDNGSENVKHTELKEAFDILTYFCDPYCSWQKGLVENTNMLIRQYLPKNAPIDSIADERIYEIQEKLNNRPRKCLGYMTPNEYFNSLT